MYAYGVNRPIQAIENLSATTLRDIIGSMTLDETLTSRDAINTKITASLDEATDRWGIKVNRVELKSIEPPVESPPGHGEGDGRPTVRSAPPCCWPRAKSRLPLPAPRAKRNRAILRAEAVKQQRIREAEGEAEALLTVQKAQADAIRMINEANPDHDFLALRSMEAMEKVADGKKLPSSSSPAICRTSPPPWPLSKRLLQTNNGGLSLFLKEKEPKELLIKEGTRKNRVPSL